MIYDDDPYGRRKRGVQRPALNNYYFKVYSERSVGSSASLSCCCYGPDSGQFVIKRALLVELRGNKGLGQRQGN